MLTDIEICGSIDIRGGEYMFMVDKEKLIHYRQYPISVLDIGYVTLHTSGVVKTYNTLEEAQQELDKFIDAMGSYSLWSDRHKLGYGALDRLRELDVNAEGYMLVPKNSTLLGILDDVGIEYIIYEDSLITKVLI